MPLYVIFYYIWDFFSFQLPSFHPTAAGSAVGKAAAIFLCAPTTIAKQYSTSCVSTLVSLGQTLCILIFIL